MSAFRIRLFRLATTRNVRGWACLLVAILLFSTVEVASKQAGLTVAPLWLAGIRFTTAALLMAPVWVAHVRRLPEPLSGREGLHIVWLGILGITLSIGCFHLALPLMQANVCAILFSMNPAFVIFLAPLLTREHFSPRLLIGIGLGVAGGMVFLVHSDYPILTHPLGLFWMFLSILLFAIYTLISKPMLHRIGAFSLLGTVFGVGGLFLLPVAWWLEGALRFDVGGFAWGWLVWLIVFGTIGGYTLYFQGVKDVGALQGSQLFFLKPFLASAFAWVVLSERITWQIIGGGVLALLAMIMAFYPVNPKRVCRSDAVKE